MTSKGSKQKKGRTIVYCTLKGKRILPLFLSPSKHGFVLGFGIKEFENIRLTVMEKEGRISWHVKDEAKYGNKPPRFGGCEPEKIERFFEKRTKKWLKKYHGNQKAWLMTDTLLSKIFEYAPKIADDGILEIPLELRNLVVTLDFENRERWNRVKIRSLIGVWPTFAMIVDEGKYKWVEPISKNMMFCYTDDQLKRFQNDLAKLMGFEDYLDYIDNRLGNKINSEIKRRFEV